MKMDCSRNSSEIFSRKPDWTVLAVTLPPPPIPQLFICSYSIWCSFLGPDSFDLCSLIPLLRFCFIQETWGLLPQAKIIVLDSKRARERLKTHKWYSSSYLFTNVFSRCVSVHRLKNVLSFDHSSWWQSCLFIVNFMPRAGTEVHNSRELYHLKILRRKLLRSSGKPQISPLKHR